MLITSKDNLQIKEAAALKDKKARFEQSRYLIEGYRCVKDSLQHLNNPTIFLSETAYARFNGEFDGYELLVCTDKVFSKITDTDNSQGVVCIADIPKKTPDYQSKYALFLDRVRDPGNMGTIIRTALAVGFNDIYCYDCVDAYNPKVVRSAMSAISRVNLFDLGADELSTLKQNGYTVFCADMNGKSVFSESLNADKICLVIGNEANGVLDEIAQYSDEIISLPMNGVESLNAAVSASVLMYQIVFGTK
jgi:TrmH family RNA methyltransferase